MRLLFDSHAVLWWLQDDRRISSTVRDAVADQAHTPFFSPVTAYELLQKQRAGKLRGVPDGMHDLLVGDGFAPLPLTFAHAAAAAELPMHHRDPWDRLLIAQAEVEGLTIVSADKVFRRYGVKVIW